MTNIPHTSGSPILRTAFAGFSELSVYILLSSVIQFFSHRIIVGEMILSHYRISPAHVGKITDALQVISDSLKILLRISFSSDLPVIENIPAASARRSDIRHYDVRSGENTLKPAVRHSGSQRGSGRKQNFWQHKTCYRQNPQTQACISGRLIRERSVFMRNKRSYPYHVRHKVLHIKQILHNIFYGLPRRTDHYSAPCLITNVLKVVKTALAVGKRHRLRVKICVV